MALVLDRNSKADTRLLSIRDGGGAADLAVDASQWRADLTNSTTYLTSTDYRLAVRSPREISVVVGISTGRSRVILNWGNAAGTVYTYRITASSGVLTFGHNSAALSPTITPPNLSASVQSYLVHWSTDYDYQGATWYSEIAICDIDSNEWSVTRIDHTEPRAPGAGEQFNLLGYGAGTLIYQGGISSIDNVRVGCRFHTTTEAAEDWVAESSPPTVSGISPTVELAPSSTSFYTEDPVEDVSTTLLDEGSFAGPIEYVANINATAQWRRLRSPALNILTNTTQAYDDSFFPSNMWRQVATTAPYTARYMCLGHVYWRPTTFKGPLSRVRVHAQTYLEAGAPGGSAIDIELSMLSLATAPGSKVPAQIPGVSTTAVALTTNHGSSGTGQWYDLGLLALASVDGGTWLALAMEFGTGTGHDFMRIKIKAITVEPYDMA